MKGSIKKKYHDNIYGVIITLVFHILLVAGLLLGEIGRTGEVKEEVILIDFEDLEEPEIPKEEPKVEKKEKTKEFVEPSNQDKGTNQASNTAATQNTTNETFDDDYLQDLKEAQDLANRVNKNLSKKIPGQEEFKMPEETTEGMNPDSIKNVIYKGKSNIKYFLENRYHVSIPIPVYLAQSGGEVVVDIVVSKRGKVLSATPRPGTYKDARLPDYAKQAALKTRFNNDSSAPSKQSGTITYNFVSQ